MRIAVSSTENKGLDSQMSPVFGRCPYFVIAVIEGGEIKDSKTIENQATMQIGGAGITTAQLMGNEGVEVVISGAAGPRAFQVFQQLEIKILQGISGTVRDNIQAYIDGKLQGITIPGPMGIGMPRKGTGIGRNMGHRAGGSGRGTGKGRQ